MKPRLKLMTTGRVYQWDNHGWVFVGHIRFPHLRKIVRAVHNNPVF